MASGHTTYLKKGTTEIDSEWSNIFVLKFDSEGRCTEYCEWYARKPEKKG